MNLIFLSSPCVACNLIVTANCHAKIIKNIEYTKNRLKKSFERSNYIQLYPIANNSPPLYGSQRSLAEGKSNWGGCWAGLGIRDGRSTPRPWRGGAEGGDCVVLYLHISPSIYIYLLILNLLTPPFRGRGNQRSLAEGESNWAKGGDCVKVDKKGQECMYINQRNIITFALAKYPAHKSGLWYSSPFFS